MGIHLKSEMASEYQISLRILGLYSQHFIFFVTHEWAQKATVLHNTRWNGLPGSRDINYLAHSYVTKKIKYREYR